MTTETACSITMKTPKIALELMVFPLWGFFQSSAVRGRCMQAGVEMLEELGRSWPEFLNRLDSHPDEAKRTFFDLSYRYLIASPPRAFYWFNEDDRLDLASGVLLRLVDDEFRRLRKYRDQGTSFLGWLRISANNYAKDVWKRQKWEQPLDDDVPLPDPNSNPVNTFDKKDIDRVREVIFSVEDRMCLRVLVWRLLYEFTNKEMTIKLGWSPDRNGEVGNIFRTCRMALIDRLKAVGINAGILET